MENNYRYADLVYLGGGYHEPSYQKEFIEEITTRFPDIKLKDAYDYIKGDRQEVYLPESITDDDYQIWIVCHGWGGSSMTWMLGDDDHRSRLVEAGKKIYPECYKPEYLD
jgi:hypothetical protein